MIHDSRTTFCVTDRPSRNRERERKKRNGPDADVLRRGEEWSVHEKPPSWERERVEERRDEGEAVG